MRSILLIIVAVSLWGCDDTRIFEENKPIKDYTWSSEDASSFEFEITDTAGRYNVYINIRHEVLYEFQNLWVKASMMLVTRKVYHLEDYITIYHIELMNIIIIVTGSIVGIAYLTEFFIAWYSGVEAEQYAFINRSTGPYWWAYALMMTCNVVSPQLFWVKRIRTSVIATFILSIVVNIGMWMERFVIIVTSLHRDYLPSSWVMFYPTFYDVGVFLFSIGFFFTAFFLFAKYFPMINMVEVKSILKATSENKR